MTPLSPIASDQLQELSVLVQSLVAEPSLEDQWHYNWGSQQFSTSLLDAGLFGNIEMQSFFMENHFPCVGGN
jgi:hypothetical protein